jgi:hypothetical protein
MTGRSSRIGIAAVSAAAICLVPIGSALAVAPASILDRAVATCSAGSLMIVELDREGRQREVDVELYADPRERWVFTVTQRGDRAITVVRSTNREGELDFWRYVTNRRGADSVTVTARSTVSGERCSGQVRG